MALVGLEPASLKAGLKQFGNHEGLTIKGIFENSYLQLALKHIALHWVEEGYRGKQRVLAGLVRLNAAQCNTTHHNPPSPFSLVFHNIRLHNSSLSTKFSASRTQWPYFRPPSPPNSPVSPMDIQGHVAVLQFAIEESIKVRLISGKIKSLPMPPNHGGLVAWCVQCATPF